MRSIWKGAVSFGLVTIPIKLYSATEEHDVPLHQVHEKDGARVRYKRVCEAEGVEVPYGEIAKGYDLPGGETVIITDEELKSLPIASSRTIEVMRFVPDEQIPGIYFSKSYYLQADGPGLKPYVLLRDALAGAGSSALVKVALRQRESLAVLRPYQDVLLLQTMLWPDEIRDTASIAPPEDVELRPQELQMAQSYIDALVGDFEPQEFKDEYAEALRALVEAKAEGHEVARADEPAAKTGEVIDLMAALEASVAEARAARAGGSGGGSASAAKKASPAKTAPAKSAPAKSAPAKTTARKAPGKAAAAKSASTSTAAKSAAKSTTVKSTPAKKTAAASSTASKSTAAKKTAAAKAPAKKAAARRSA
ncbi:MAG: end-binding protein Ku [Cryptosporangiaceae bacterium]|nr:end-binding protein Ku [Cryptosporangiaceae bacterium]